MEEHRDPLVIKLLGVFLGVFLILASGIMYYRQHIHEPAKLGGSHMYTVGFVYRIVPTEHSMQPLVSYLIDGVQYRSFCSYRDSNEREVEKGDRFYLEYYPSDPEICKVLIDKRVPDSVASPVTGWARIPD